MALTRLIHIVHSTQSAVQICIALVVVGMALTPAPLRAADAPNERQLAAELRIVRADVMRLDTRTLPPLHRQGLRQRIAGALGVLPWLLRLGSDKKGADAVRVWQEKPLDTAAKRARLVALLTRLGTAHRIDVAYFKALPDTSAARNEARAIHNTYCASCHDGAGNGDPGLARPARDLFTMAHSVDASTSLARLINGIKGDAAIRFGNPLSDARLAALWRYYRTGPR